MLRLQCVEVRKIVVFPSAPSRAVTGQAELTQNGLNHVVIARYRWLTLGYGVSIAGCFRGGSVCCRNRTSDSDNCRAKNCE